MKEKIRALFSNVWTIPNILTMLRMVLIPVFVVLYMNGQPKAALAVFIIASLTDQLDGFLARKLNQITDFGKLFDPLADKLMVITVMICHGISGVIPWAAIIIVICKELLMVIGGAFILKNGVVVYSNMAGKTAMVFFVAALILCFFHEEFLSLGWSVPLDIIFVWMAVGQALQALVIYAAGSLPKLKGK